MNTTPYIPLNHLGTLKVSGPDAASFLQGQLTSDILKLTPYAHQLGAFCNRLGRVLALMDIFRIDDDYFLTLPLEIIESIAQELQKYIVFSKAKIQNVSDSYASHAYLQSEPKAPEACIAFTRGCITQHFGPSAAMHLDAPQSTLTDFLLAQMRALIPYIGLAQTGEFLPHPLGLIALDAVSFHKGCFVGQEIIARMQYRTKVKKHLRYFEIPAGSNLLPQSDIYIGEKAIGVVVNILPIPNGNDAVLGIIDDTPACHPRESGDPGLNLDYTYKVR